MSDAPLLAFEGVFKAYGEGTNRVTALHPSDFAVYPGEMVCVAGPSGSGKTTLLNIAGLLDRPTGGEVTLGGVPTSRLPRKERSNLRKTGIGFVFQSANLLPVLTALENIEFSLLLAGQPEAGRRETAEKYLELVGIADQKNKFPRQMSGGQVQRAAVARAIAKRPGLVIADEPTASLDGATAAALVELFFKINTEEGTTFLFSSHDRRVIEAAGRVAGLSDGRLLP